MEGKVSRGLKLAVVVLGLVFVAGGCAKKDVTSDKSLATEPAKAESTKEKKSDTESLVTSAKKDTGAISEGRTSAPMLPVYFDFDKSNIRDDQKSRIEKNAKFLKENAGVKIKVEGNCDERGTNEYNMALGERRANSAKKYLLNLGVTADRLETLSYGEEKPLLFGHDELSWAQNRRDDFVIK